MLQVIPVELRHIQKISQIRLHPDKDIEHEPSIMVMAYDSIKTILTEHPDGAPLDPMRHMKIKGERFEVLYKVIYKHCHLFIFIFIYIIYLLNIYFVSN